MNYKENNILLTNKEKCVEPKTILRCCGIIREATYLHNHVLQYISLSI
jgi:hypothetical protein